MLLRSLSLNGIYETLIELAIKSDSNAAAEKSLELLKKLMAISALINPEESKFAGLLAQATEFGQSDCTLASRAKKTLKELESPPKCTVQKEISVMCWRIYEYFMQTPHGGLQYQTIREYTLPSLKEKEKNEEVSQFVHSFCSLSDITNKKESYLNWNWTYILEALQSCLLNPNKTMALLKTDEFAILLSFFQPSKASFLDLNWVSRCE
jgi:hypothetical protein